MLNNVNLFVTVNFALHLESTISLKMLINVLITALMDTLKVSTTTAFPLSSATPLAAAPVKSKTMPLNAQLALQL